MKVVVASLNPVKIKSVKSGFCKYFNKQIEVIGTNVESGVADQPMSDEETLQGAVNRAKKASEKNSGADYCVGIEGGVQQCGDQLIAFAWVAITDGRQLSKARTGSFFLPPEVAKLVKKGIELGDADDIVFKKQNSKQKNGAVGLLTKDVITRETLYHQAIILALIPFLNRTLYFRVEPTTC